MCRVTLKISNEIVQPPRKQRKLVRGPGIFRSNPSQQTSFARSMSVAESGIENGSVILMRANQQTQWAFSCRLILTLKPICCIEILRISVYSPYYIAADAIVCGSIIIQSTHITVGRVVLLSLHSLNKPDTYKQPCGFSISERESEKEAVSEIATKLVRCSLFFENKPLSTVVEARDLLLRYQHIARSTKQQSSPSYRT